MLPEHSGKPNSRPWKETVSEEAGRVARPISDTDTDVVEGRGSTTSFERVSTLAGKTSLFQIAQQLPWG